MVSFCGTSCTSPNISEGVVRTLDRPASANPAWNSDRPDPATSRFPYRVYNIGNNAPVELARYIELVEEFLGRKAQKNMLPLQPGDVPDTYADVEDLVRDVGYKPATPIATGVKAFIDWYRGYYRV